MPGLNDFLDSRGGISVAYTALTSALAGFVSQKVPALKKTHVPLY